jgi:hypothetical protein
MTVHLIDELNSNASTLVGAWKACYDDELPDGINPQQSLSNAVRDVGKSLALLQKLSMISNRFFRADKLISHNLSQKASNAEIKWSSFTLQQTNTITDEICNENPQVLLALSWLYNLGKSPSFKLIWDQELYGIEKINNKNKNNVLSISNNNSDDDDDDDFDNIDNINNNDHDDNDNENVKKVIRSPQQLLFDVVQVWHKVWVQLNDSTMKFSDLETLAPNLLVDGDLELLSSTANSALKHIQDAENDENNETKLPKYLWPTGGIDGSWCYKQKISLRRYETMRKTFQETEQLQRRLAALRLLIKPEAQVQVDDCNTALLKLNSELVKRWQGFTMSNLDELAILSESVDSRITNLNPDILECLTSEGCADLFEWLQSIPKDGDFQAAVEMAMGRSELETPPELWVDDSSTVEPNDSSSKSTGRPDEEKLSMLSSIRSTFHKLLYKHSEDRSPLVFNSLKEALNVLSDSVVFSHSSSSSSPENVNAARLINSLNICCSLRLALAELLGDDSDSTAPNRLMLLRQSAWDSHWVIETKHNISFSPTEQFRIQFQKNQKDNNQSISSSSSLSSKKHEVFTKSMNEGHGLLPTLASTLRLEYKVPRKGVFLNASQSLAELSDFQGSCVLAKTASGEAQTVAIDVFTQQFRWVQEVGRSVLALRNSGHFDYQGYLKRVPLAANDSVGVLARMVIEKRAELQAWEQEVARVRRNGGMINYFDMFQIWQFCRLIENAIDDKNENDDDEEEVMAWFCHSITPLLARLHPVALDKQSSEGKMLVATFAKELLNSWKKFERSQLVSSRDNEASYQLLQNKSSSPATSSSSQSSKQSCADKLWAIRESLNQAVAIVSNHSLTLPRTRLLFPDFEENKENGTQDESKKKQVSSLSSASSLSSSSSTSMTKASKSVLQSGIGKKSATVMAGLRLLVANDWKNCLAISLSSFFKHGILPEWYNCLVCHKDLPFEILSNFILRASELSKVKYKDHDDEQGGDFEDGFVMDDDEFDTTDYHNNNNDDEGGDDDTSSTQDIKKEGKVFVLVGIHLLSLDDQHLALEMIRSSPLVNNTDEEEQYQRDEFVVIETNNNNSTASKNKLNNNEKDNNKKKKQNKKTKYIKKCLNSLIIVAVVDGTENTAAGGSIASTRSTSPLVTQLGSYRSVEEPLNDNELSTLYQHHGPSSIFHSQGIHLLSSHLPGAGKSFHAKLMAHDKNANYIHVRVNKTLSPSMLAMLIEKRIKAELYKNEKVKSNDNDDDDKKDDNDEDDDDDEFVEINDNDEEDVNDLMTESTLELNRSNNSDILNASTNSTSSMMIHLDLAESVNGNFDFALFDLITLGCLTSSNSSNGSGGNGGLWWWNSKNTSFVIELSSPSLYRRLSSLSWIENIILTPSSQSFIADSIRLEIGLGEHVYYSRRCDGTTSLVSDDIDGKQPTLPKHVIIKGLKKQYLLNNKKAIVKAFDDHLGKFVVEIEMNNKKYTTARIAAKYLKPRELTENEIKEEEDEKILNEKNNNKQERIGISISNKKVIDLPDEDAITAWETWHRGVGENNNLKDDGTTTNAYVRLQYVCGCLDMMNLLGGYLPLDVEVPISNLLKKGGLSGERCFVLLSRAMNATLDDASSLNFWSVWAFVNGLFIQIKGLNDQRLVIFSALSKDANEDGVTDNASKQLLKAALVSFACSSTLEMMTRQRRLANPQRLACLRLQNHSYGSINGLWIRQPFDHAGRPVFSASGKYIYFRPARPKQQVQESAAASADEKLIHYFSSNCWVMDNSIRCIGVPMSISTTEELCCQWASIPKPQQRIDNYTKHEVFTQSITQSSNNNSYQTVIIFGTSELYQFPLDQTLNLNGRYVLSGQNVNGCPHYVKLFEINSASGSVSSGAAESSTSMDDLPKSNKAKKSNNNGFGHRRHLFYSMQERTWVIAARCDESEGILAMEVAGNNFTTTSHRTSSFNSFNSEWILFTDGTKSSPTLGNVSYQYDETDFVIIPLSAEQAEKDYGIGVINENKLKEEVFDDREYLSDLLPWSSSNHNSVLISVSGSERGGLRMLCLKGNKLSTALHPDVKNFVDVHGVPFGADPKSSYGSPSSDQAGILTRLFGEITDRHLSPSVAMKLMGGRFVLTADTLLKVRAIVARLRCGVPVILMGECGCGKTALLNYLCAWLGIDLEILDVHGGTTERDLEEAFARAEKKACNGKQNFLFLDEMNACLHTGLVEEAITKHTLHGRPLNDNLRILAAANPYRKRSQNVLNTSNSHSGFVYEGAVTTMEKDLVYNVHPIPASLHEFIFDFGALSAMNESAYAVAMVKSILVRANALEARAAAAMISAAQKHVRECEGDPSAVSLRDVARCLKLVRFFNKAGGSNKNASGGGGGNKGAVSLSVPLTLAIGHVYYFRLGSMTDRQRLWVELRNALIMVRATDASRLPQDFLYLLEEGKFDEIINNAKRRFCNRFDLEPGVALNQALMENLYVVVVCILNNLPVFVVGKPGSSKTLAMAVIVSNLQGEQSNRPFWRKFPAVTLFSFQCSPMTQADGILQQFNMACNYAKHASNTRTVLLLDEVGLAEHSPDMPLKVLHGILVDPPIAVVGISNWALDAAKMNRAICLMRPEPKEADLQSTGESIVYAAPPEPAPTPPTTSSEGAAAEDDEPPPPPSLARSTSIPTADLSSVLGPLASAYHSVYSRQQKIAGGRDFIGMRDYYSMLKMLRGSILKTARSGVHGSLKSKLDPQALDNAIYRNFGGKPILLTATIQIFRKKCFEDITITGRFNNKNNSSNKNNDEDDDDELYQIMKNNKNSKYQFSKPPTLDLINENLNDQNARHLMVLTKQGAALPLLLNANAITLTDSVVLVGSDFEEDRAELRLVQQINQVKRAMAAGKVVVLVNHDQIYEALYDVLNQRFISRTSPTTGKTVKMLRLAIGARSQLCPVADGFRVIVIAEQNHAYKNLDLPLLNRFEKQLLLAFDLLTPSQQLILAQLEDWVIQVANECALIMGKPKMKILRKTCDPSSSTIIGDVVGIKSVVEDTSSSSTSKNDSKDTSSTSRCEVFLSSIFPGFDESSLHTLILGISPEVSENMTSSSSSSSIDEVDKQQEDNKDGEDNDSNGVSGDVVQSEIDNVVSQAKQLLSLVASPVAHTYSKSLSDAWKLAQLTRIENNKKKLSDEFDIDIIDNDDENNKEKEIKSFFEDHADLKTVFEKYLSVEPLLLKPKNKESLIYSEQEANQIAQTSAQLLSVATYSSLPELSTKLLSQSCSNFNSKSIRLASISSEWQLTQMLTSFYNGNSDDSFEFSMNEEEEEEEYQQDKDSVNQDKNEDIDDRSLLVIQIDPASSSQGMMVHARYLIEQTRSEWISNYSNQLQLRNNQLVNIQSKDTSSSSLPINVNTNPLRHVVLIVHLPPAVRMKARTWCLDMHYSNISSWEYVFVDDITPEVNHNNTMFVEQSSSSSSSDLSRGQKTEEEEEVIVMDTSCLLPSTQVMVTSSLADLGQYALKSGAFSSLLLTSLSRCSAPPPPPMHSLLLDFHHRLSTIKKRFGFDHHHKTLSSQSSEVNNVEIMIRNTLIDILSASDNDSSKGALHVQLATGIGSSGSLRQSLHLAVEHILSQTLATMISYLDRDFNLSLSSEAAADILLSDTGYSQFFATQPSQQQSSSSSLSSQEKEVVVPIWYQWFINPKLLIDGMENIRENLWREMVLLIFDSSSLIRKAGRLDGASSLLIENSGAYGSLAATFPFSYRIWSVLDSEGASDLLLRCRRRDVVDDNNDDSSMDMKRGKEIKDRASQLGSLAISVFGESCVNQWRKFGEIDQGMCFLRDWILAEGGAYPAGHGLSIQLLIRIHAVAVNAHLNTTKQLFKDQTNNNTDTVERNWCYPITPVSILASLTIIGRRHIFYLASILSCPSFPSSILSDCLFAAEGTIINHTTTSSSSGALWSLNAVISICQGFIKHLRNYASLLSSTTVKTTSNTKKRKIKLLIHKVSHVIISIASDMMSFLLSLENEFNHDNKDKEENFRCSKVIQVALNWQWLYLAASLLVDIADCSSLKDSNEDVSNGYMTKIISICLPQNTSNISSSQTSILSFDLVSSLLIAESSNNNNNNNNEATQLPPPPYAATLIRTVLNKNAGKERELIQENKSFFSMFSSSSSSSSSSSNAQKSSTSVSTTSIPELVPDLELVDALACLANGKRAVENSPSKKCREMCTPYVNNVCLRYLCLQSLLNMGDEGKKSLSKVLDIHKDGGLQLYANNLEDRVVKFDNQENNGDNDFNGGDDDEMVLTMMLSTISSASSSSSSSLSTSSLSTLEFGQSIALCRKTLKKFAKTILHQCNRAESTIYDRIDHAQKQLEIAENKLVDMKKTEQAQANALRQNRNNHKYNRKQHEEATRRVKQAKQAVSAAQLALSALPIDNIAGHIAISEKSIISKLKLFTIIPSILELKGPASYLLKLLLSQSGYDGLSKIFIYCKQHVWLQQSLVSVGVVPSSLNSSSSASSAVVLSNMAQWLSVYASTEEASGPSSLDGTTFALSSSSQSDDDRGEKDDDKLMNLYEHFRGRINIVLSETLENKNHKSIISFGDDLKAEIKNFEEIYAPGVSLPKKDVDNGEGGGGEDGEDDHGTVVMVKKKQFTCLLLAIISTTFDTCFPITSTKRDTHDDAHFLKIGYKQKSGIDQITSSSYKSTAAPAASGGGSEEEEDDDDYVDDVKYDEQKVIAQKLALKLHHTVSGYFSRLDNPILSLMYKFTSQQTITLGQIAMSISSSSSSSAGRGDVFKGGELAKFPCSVRRLCLHLGIIACRHQTSWLGKAVYGKLEFLKHFLPTIPDDDPNRLFSALEKTEGRLKWYTCPRGHPYSVGECGMPMQEGRCSAPGCGAIIGGQSHVVAKGCRTVSVGAIKVDDGPVKKGYDTIELGHYEVDRKKQGYILSPLGVICMRIVLHLTIVLGTEQSLHSTSSSSSAGAASSSSSKQGNKTSSSSPSPDLSSTCNYLIQDFNALARYLEISNVNDVIMVTHLLLNKFEKVLSLNSTSSLFPNQLFSKENRTQFEKKFIFYIVDPLFPSGKLSLDTKKQLDKGKEICGDAAFMARLLKFLNGNVWDILNESSDYSDKSSNALVSSSSSSLSVIDGGWMWRMRKTTSIAGLRSWLTAKSSRVKEFPFLTAFFDEDDAIDETEDDEAILVDGKVQKKKRKKSVLELVSCGADILEWHAILFEAIGDRSITRADAMSFTNSDVIAWLPDSKQANAWIVLDKYCIAFNDTLPLVEALYECQRNPFLTSKNEVNLTGSGDVNDDDNISNKTLGMSVDTPIAFSLPSAPPGEVDASGLCTLMILRRLERAHNALVERFTQARSTAVSHDNEQQQLASSTNLKLSTSTIHQQNDDEEEGDDEEVYVAPTAPAISYLTLPSLSRKALLSYDRSQLLPILARCSNQPLGDDNGNSAFEFDGHLLEDELAKMLRLDGGEVGPVLITVRQFEYSGENLRAIGTLAAIDNRCPQVPLPISLSNALHREVDTANSLTRLLRVLETCAHIVGGGFGSGTTGGAGGSGGINPNTKLTEFVCGTLLHNEKDWKLICPKAIASHATLSHLRDLLLTVEAKELGRLPTHAVALKFRDPLNPMDLQELKVGLSYIPTSSNSSSSSANGYRLDTVLGPFRDLLEGPLADPSDFSPNESLRNFLCYQDIDLEDPGTWFAEYFPYNLKLAHALETYLILAAAASEQPEH